MKIYSLSAKDRSNIWTQLNSNQKKVFDLYTMNEITSALLTRSFRLSSAWRLVSVNVDYGWEMRKKTNNHRGYQYCECGRKLKYQYEIESLDNSKHHLYLGSTHFAEHAGIPVEVAQEVRTRINKIQIYMDEILYRYKQGERFPETRFGYLFERGVMSEPTQFNMKMKHFREAKLPLFHVDEDRLISLKVRYRRPRKSKLERSRKSQDIAQMNQILITIRSATKKKFRRKFLNYKTYYLNKVNRCLTILQNKPALHKSNVSQEIQKLYQLITESSSDSIAIIRQIDKLANVIKMVAVDASIFIMI